MGMWAVVLLIVATACAAPVSLQPRAEGDATSAAQITGPALNAATSPENKAALEYMEAFMAKKPKALNLIQGFAKDSCMAGLGLSSVDMAARQSTYDEVLGLLNARGVKEMVETGTARNGLANSVGDGASTCVFGAWAKCHGAHLTSVDISPENIAESKKATDGMGLQDAVAHHTGDSIGFLKSYSKPIDFLYLDSYDYDRNDPDPSQDHHLKEIQGVYPSLHSNTVILLDDCDLPGGGKCKKVVDWLVNEKKEWHLTPTTTDTYQQILLRNEGGAPAQPAAEEPTQLAAQEPAVDNSVVKAAPSVLPGPENALVVEKLAQAELKVAQAELKVAQAELSLAESQQG